LPLVGNDVVDLAESENIGKSGDQRFCKRVFNSSELSLIADSARPDPILWAIWAAKEAAYKAISRSNPDVCSIPKKYPVIIERSTIPEGAAPLQGKVVTPLGELPVLIFMGAEMIHVIAAETAEALQRIIFRVDQIDPNNTDPSRFVKKALLRQISCYISCSVGELSIVKEKRRPWPPCIIFRGRRLSVETSLSHDGRFVAFAFDPSAL
jgi:hypothetical protein